MSQDCRRRISYYTYTFVAIRVFRYKSGEHLCWMGDTRFVYGGEIVDNIDIPCGPSAWIFVAQKSKG